MNTMKFDYLKQIRPKCPIRPIGLTADVSHGTRKTRI